jgi:cytochrome P450
MCILAVALPGNDSSFFRSIRMSTESPPNVAPVPDWDPGEPRTVPERMEQLKQMRERCPVAYTDRGDGYWTLLRHADIVAAALDPQTFGNSGPPRHGVHMPPLEIDPPAHREFRFLLNPFFMPKRVQALEPRVRAIAQRLIEPLLEKGEGDLAKELSYPLPVLTLCALLDLPEEVWPRVKRLSEETLLVESHDPDEKALARAAHQELMVYARELIEERKRNPREPNTDIASAIAAAQIEGKPIEPEAAAAMVRLLISAGHNSTTSGLGNALLYLAGHPQEQQRLRENPGELPAAIEELLRYETPVQAMPRYLRKEVQLHGRQIKAGERIDLVFAAANRDEQVFAQADQCVLDRKPNRHVAFGHGIHTCLGAPIARMEIRVGLELLLAKTRNFSIAGEVKRPPYHRLGVESLPARIVR